MRADTCSRAGAFESVHLLVVGDAVGLFVGDAVGLLEGEAVGLLEGEAVGPGDPRRTRTA